MLKLISILMLILSGLMACGGSSSETGDGQLRLQIENARLPASLSLPDQGKSQTSVTSPLKAIVVTKFKVSITGSGIASPIEAEAPASATEIEALNIPVGDDRTILIEAFNDSDQVIRRGKLTGISIEPGVIAPIKARLHIIPSFLNIKDGSVVLAGRFHIQGFGEPGTSLKIETASKAQPNLSLNEGANGAAMIVSPSLSNGMFDFNPPQHLLGKQTLTIRDEGTGESSKVTIAIVKSERPGRQMVSAGGSDPMITVGAVAVEAKQVHLPQVFRALDTIK